MASENGNGWIWKVITAVLIPAILMLANYVIANDNMSRSRDDSLEERIVIACEKQGAMNQEILVSLKEIQTDMKYVKKVASN